MQTLKLCPFCGNAPTSSHMGSGSYTVSCSNGHHINTEASKEKAITAWNTRPAAPVGGLETVAYRHMDTWEGAPKYWKYHERDLQLDDAVTEPLVTRSQAEAIIAAKDEALNGLLQALKHHTGDNHGLMAIRKLDERAEKAEAKAEALETQLAAAKKALEWYANPEIYRSHPHGIGFEDRDKSYVAKAALEDRP